jgi:hypothetical protein
MATGVKRSEAALQRYINTSWSNVVSIYSFSFKKTDDDKKVANIFCATIADVFSFAPKMMAAGVAYIWHSLDEENARKLHNHGRRVGRIDPITREETERVVAFTTVVFYGLFAVGSWVYKG